MLVVYDMIVQLKIVIIGIVQLAINNDDDDDITKIENAKSRSNIVVKMIKLFSKF